MSGFIYFVRNRQNGLIKIGRSKNPERRLQQLKNECNAQMVLLWKFRIPNQRRMFDGIRLCSFEAMAHVTVADCHVYGEWFDLNPIDFAKVVRRLHVNRYKRIPESKLPRRSWLAGRRGRYRSKFNPEGR